MDILYHGILFSLLSAGLPGRSAYALISKPAEYALDSHRIYLEEMGNLYISHISRGGYDRVELMRFKSFHARMGRNQVFFFLILCQQIPHSWGFSV